MRHKYPHSPGYKEGETSREAAESMEERAPTLRQRAFEYICRFPLHTADEVAKGLKETPYAIRPRITELRKMKMVVNDGRGKNKSGRPAHRWRAA